MNGDFLNSSIHTSNKMCSGEYRRITSKARGEDVEALADKNMVYYTTTVIDNHPLSVYYIYST
jgi:hypothetical protein